MAKPRHGRGKHPRYAHDGAAGHPGQDHHGHCVSPGVYPAGVRRGAIASVRNDPRNVHRGSRRSAAAPARIGPRTDQHRRIRSMRGGPLLSRASVPTDARNGGLSGCNLIPDESRQGCPIVCVMSHSLPDTSHPVRMVASKPVYRRVGYATTTTRFGLSRSLSTDRSRGRWPPHYTQTFSRAYDVAQDRAAEQIIAWLAQLHLGAARTDSGGRVPGRGDRGCDGTASHVPRGAIRTVMCTCRSFPGCSPNDSGGDCTRSGCMTR